MRRQCLCRQFETAILTLKALALILLARFYSVTLNDPALFHPLFATRRERHAGRAADLVGLVGAPAPAADLFRAFVSAGLERPAAAEATWVGVGVAVPRQTQ